MGRKGRGRGQAGQKGGETIADPPSSFRIRWGSSPPPTLLYCPGSSFSAKAPQAKRGTFFLEEVKKGYEAAAPPALQLREGGSGLPRAIPSLLFAPLPLPSLQSSGFLSTLHPQRMGEGFPSILRSLAPPPPSPGQLLCYFSSSSSIKSPQASVHPG